MKHAVHKLSLLALAVVALAVPAAAKADFITQTFMNPSMAVPYTYNFAANQFNPSLGTLTSVTFTVTSNVVASVTVVNLNSTAQSFTNATASVPITVTGPNSTAVVLTATGTTAPQSGTVGADVGGIPGMTMISGLTVTASSTTSLTGGALATYIGTGTSSLSFVFGAGNGTYSGTGPSNVYFGGSAAADAKVVITYTFTPATIPEPASLAMVGMGLGGLFVARRFRRRAV